MCRAAIASLTSRGENGNPNLVQKTRTVFCIISCLHKISNSHWKPGVAPTLAITSCDISIKARTTSFQLASSTNSRPKEEIGYLSPGLPMHRTGICGRSRSPRIFSTRSCTVSFVARERAYRIGLSPKLSTVSLAEMSSSINDRRYNAKCVLVCAS